LSAVFEPTRFPLRIPLDSRLPDDRTSCLPTEIDFDSTVVAFGEECPAALLTDERLEELHIQPEDRVDVDGDVLNTVNGAT
jgi:hypothetical protein